MRNRALLLAAALGFSAIPAVRAQQPADPAAAVRPQPQPRTITVYRLVDGRKANFDVKGVGPNNSVRGSLEIEYKNGRAAMRLRTDNLLHPQRVGGAYTAYVFWAVTGDGKVVRLQELPADGRVDVRAELTSQTVGVLATAEPYAEVERPSPETVLETGAFLSN